MINFNLDGRRVSFIEGMLVEFGLKEKIIQWMIRSAEETFHIEEDV